MSFYSDEYKHVLLAERVMSRLLEKEDLKAAEGAQVTRALCDAVRLKRDMRGVPDPKPVDSQPKVRKPKTSPGPSSSDLPA